MAEPVVKPAPEPSRVEEGTVFLRNPSGVIHDMMEPHLGIEAAKKGDGGWRFASVDEIRDYCKLHNIEPPDFAAYAARVKTLRKDLGEPELAIPPAPSADEAGLQPVRQTARSATK